MYSSRHVQFSVNVSNLYLPPAKEKGDTFGPIDFIAEESFSTEPNTSGVLKPKILNLAAVAKAAMGDSSDVAFVFNVELRSRGVFNSVRQGGCEP
eukprot:CAMPEP_0116572938 /NCGR_PEP_ID=MMETSP0397-20121206/18470_1 /TAXON_ID=216820 /ORGANISM="Cyclophora tenuis, Strain ECT3854" /LENGTH=94 /DNA_ID=CAMNT_0004101355 /DNA_START=151 /DNA_END=432 /DNA_ORIENTATION=-